MIIWFTGQPNSGKTTLSGKLHDYYVTNNQRSIIIDGDNLRKTLNNNDYSIDGRRKNIQDAIQLSMLYNTSSSVDHVIVALVSPFRDLRESIKSNKNHVVKEIYLYSDRQREGKMVSYYEPPIKNYLGINTDINNVEQSLELIIRYISTTIV